MSIYVGTNDVEKVYIGDRLVQVIYHGNDEVFRLPNLPNITSLSISPDNFNRANLPTTNRTTITFSVTGSTRNTITAISGNTQNNVPLTTSTTAVVPIPSNDTRYVLTSTNAAGSITRTVDFIVWTSVNVELIKDGGVLQQQVPLSNLINQYQYFNYTVEGHPRPSLTFNDPAINIQRDYDRNDFRFRVFRQSQPGVGATTQTFTLTGRNDYSSDSSSQSVEWPSYPGG